jgi:putative hemolysin
MSAQTLFFLTLAAIIFQAFFAMMEMAVVSFNKVRLQYYLARNDRKAQLISYLLMRPGILFGTTLIGIDAALQIGSECARRFYAAMGLNPDLAPLSQVILVLIFAELAPLIAARRYAEHVVMLGVRALYFFSIVLRPLVMVLDGIISAFFKIMGFKKPVAHALTKEEIQKAIETREDRQGYLKEEVFDRVMANMFSLKNQTAADLMHPVSRYMVVPAMTTLGLLRSKMTSLRHSFILVYDEHQERLTGYFPIKAGVFASSDTPIRHFVQSAWFVAQDFNLYQLIDQFKKRGKSIAFVVDHQGKTLGVVTLMSILDAVFEVHEQAEAESGIHLQRQAVHLHRSFPGSTSVRMINRTYHIHIPHEDEDQTLVDLMQQALGHHPSLNESIRIDHFELSVEEAPLIGEMTILVHTIG